MNIVNGELWVYYTDGTSQNLGSTGGTNADDGTLLFILRTDGTYAVKAGEKAVSVESIEIPATYQGKPVVRIEDDAFSKLNALKSVTLPDSITEIGNSAFYYCTSLNTIAIPDGVTSIGDKSFAGCKSISAITIPDSVNKIGEYAFNIPNVVVTVNCKSLQTIRPYAFEGASALIWNDSEPSSWALTYTGVKTLYKKSPEESVESYSQEITNYDMGTRTINKNNAFSILVSGNRTTKNYYSYNGTYRGYFYFVDRECTFRRN